MSQQLVKKGANGGYSNVMPKSWIEAIKDKNTGKTLAEILQSFNMYFLPYDGNSTSTRCLVPTMLRKKGLWITYVKYDGNVYTEWYAADEIDDKSWGDSSNWRIGNNTLVGDITISANGNWVINGTETEFKAVGEKGNTPLIRVANNRLQVSYDLGDTYIDVTNNPVYTKFRWYGTTGDTQANNVGRIQASTDEGKTWTNMSNDFTNNLHIKKYIGVNESLPTSGIAEGTIYAKGPYYAEDDTLNDNPIYRLWVYAWKGNTLAWQDNGEFQSIVAGVVQETGDSETKVMSQKAVSEKLSELGSEIDQNKGIFNKQEKEVLYIVDEQGRVIAKFDKDGVHSVDFNIGGESILSIIDRNKNKSYFDDYSNSFSVVDRYGQVIAKIDEDGIRDINFDPSLKKDELVITDRNGYVILRVDKNGVHSINTNEGYENKNDEGYIPSGIVLNIIYGQSLSFHGTFTDGIPMYSMLKFNNQFDYTMSDCSESILNDEQALDEYFKDGFVNAVSDNLRGTGAGHANRKFMELLRDENDININIKEGLNPNYQFQLVNIKPSEVNSWSELANRDGLYYRRLLAAVRYGKKFANKLGVTFSVGSLMYMQGESNADNADSVRQWYDKLWAMFSIINKDVKEITGQSDNILFLPYQMASHEADGLKSATSNLALAELQIALEDGVVEDDYSLSSVAKSIIKDGDSLIDRKHIQMGAIMVSLDYASDTDHIHATDHSYMAAGAQWGVQLKRTIYDKNPIKPIHPSAHNITKMDGERCIMEIQFHVPVKPLVIDTLNRECQSQRAKDKFYGFSIIKDGAEIIESVKLIGNDKIAIVCNTSPLGCILTYAIDGWKTGGNLRDSQNIKYTVGDFDYNVYNWCPIFKYEIK